jgi:peptidoglycan hydrolase CwlO-like protein
LKYISDCFRQGERDTLKEKFDSLKRNLKKNKKDVAKNVKNLDKLTHNFKKNLIDAMKDSGPDDLQI